MSDDVKPPAAASPQVGAEPPPGIALAALQLCGNRHWPGIWPGSFLANTGVFIGSAGRLVHVVLGMGIGAGRVISLALCLWWVVVSSHAATLQQEYRITTWETEDGLPENSATAMVQTPEGYLWFGTFNGLVRFDGVRFTPFNPQNTPELPGAGIVNLHLHKSGRLWISTDKGPASTFCSWTTSRRWPRWAKRS